MKKILLFLSIMLIPLMSNADVFKFKCFQDKYKYMDGSSEGMDWQSADVLVVIDGAKDKIKIFSHVEQNFDIIKYGNEIVNGNGDKEAYYSCVDQDGVKCSVSLVFFPYKEGARHTATLTIEYANIHYYYRLKRDD